MAIRFLTDSTADILPEEAAQRDIDVVPLKVLFGEESYRDNVDIAHQEFFEKLVTSKVFPTTSQPSPEDFLPYFEKARDQGDTLICLHISAVLSGTMQSAQIAKEMCGYDNIYIIDSMEAIIGLRMLVDPGIYLRDHGSSAEEIVAELESAKHRVRLFAVLDTLEFLHKGGRLSTAVTVLGTLLKIKPLVTLKEGLLSVMGKGRGTKDCIRLLLEMAGDDLHQDPRLPVYYGFTRDPSLCHQLKEVTDKKYNLTGASIYSVGAVIGAHVGPNGAVFGFIEAP
ncbi:MAG: DegV family protein [Oscillospiraceae bacterium]|nr:DegV family protein [Oscillospiraceae bacterium]